ncbi:MAG: hypothetical protein WCG78_07110 [Candidatus Omnitrophota bacterium]
MSYEFDLLYYVALFKRAGKRLAVALPVVVMVTGLFSALMPTVYISTTTILLSSGSTGSAISSLSRLLDVPVLSGSSGEDVLISILTSKRMARDIGEQFSGSSRKKVWWDISTRPVTGGMAINVRGPDPELTKNISRFCIQDLDKINGELQITTNRPMVKVLDEAVAGSPASKQVARKMVIAGILTLVLTMLGEFFVDYFKTMRAAQRKV